MPKKQKQTSRHPAANRRNVSSSSATKMRAESNISNSSVARNTLIDKAKQIIDTANTKIIALNSQYVALKSENDDLEQQIIDLRQEQKEKEEIGADYKDKLVAQ